MAATTYDRCAECDHSRHPGARCENVTTETFEHPARLQHRCGCTGQLDAQAQQYADESTEWAPGEPMTEVVGTAWLDGYAAGQEASQWQPGDPVYPEQAPPPPGTTPTPIPTSERVCCCATRCDDHRDCCPMCPRCTALDQLPFMTPKALTESLCVAEQAVSSRAALYPDDPHVQSASRNLGTLLRMLDEHRPTGTDGKHGHGERCTDTCGCEQHTGAWSLDFQSARQPKAS